MTVLPQPLNPSTPQPLNPTPRTPPLNALQTSRSTPTRAAGVRGWGLVIMVSRPHLILLLGTSSSVLRVANLLSTPDSLAPSPQIPTPPPAERSTGLAVRFCWLKSYPGMAGIRDACKALALAHVTALRLTDAAEHPIPFA